MAETDDGSEEDTVLSVFREQYHIPVLAGILTFMFWTRFQNFDVFTSNGDDVRLQAVDSWYHWRATNWTTDNFPWTLSFDPWTGFPDGATPGAFGTLFDQIVAAVALVIGLGSPGESDVLMAALITVPALGTLVALPVYAIGKRLGTRLGGLAGVGLLALFTGGFFIRSTAGQFDHHPAEALFMSLAVLAVIAALTVAGRDRPVWELVRSRDWTALRRPTIYSALAGVAVTLYIYVWPPGVVLVGILGLYFVVQLSLDHYQGNSVDHLAFVGVVSMLVVAAGTAAKIQQTGFSATGFDFFQPLFALLVAGGCLFMAALARVWNANNLDRRGYPAAVALSILGTLGLLAVLLPGLVDTLTSNLSGRLLPFGHSPSALTVQEIDPPGALVPYFGDQFGWAFWSGLLSLPVLAVQSVFRSEDRGQYLFVLVWVLMLISMGATQVRFSYYLAVAVAVMNAHLVGFLVAGMSTPDSADDLVGLFSGVRVSQVLAVVLVMLVLFIPLLPPVASETPASLADQTGPGSDSVTWESSNEWLAENTPAVGNYGGAGNTDAIGYGDEYDQPTGAFDYPTGSYGVMSWWDYGHLITVQGERVPHANPFQQNARSAAAFLTAQNESRAMLYLDAIAAGESPTHESDPAELSEAVATSEDEPGIQYVMIDDAMAAGKFFAITQWTGPEYDAYIEEEERTFVQGRGENRNQQSRTVPVGGDYYDTMLARLYLEDAQGLEQFRLVNESPDYSAVGFFGNAQRSTPVGSWTSVSETANENDTSVVEAFQQARRGDFGVPLGLGQDIHDPYVASSVKTFERVEGATITGETAAGEQVRATVTMETETGRSFDYEQTANVTDGGFELTVPYPTQETLGPEDGYANASVLATSGYNLTVLDGSGEATEEATDVTVPEEAVQTGGTVSVELQEVLDPPESSFTNLDVAGQGTTATVSAGTDEPVAVEVANVGEEPGGFDLTLTVGNETVTRTTDSIAANSSTAVVFDGVLGDLDPGEYTVEVATDDDSVAASLVVEADDTG